MIAYRTNHICIVRTNLREMAPYWTTFTVFRWRRRLHVCWFVGC